VNALRGLVVPFATLALQVGLSRLWPDGARFVQFMIVPVIWYGVAGSQRGAMLVGCMAGLLHDAWFELPLGVCGFKWTLIGWALGAVAVRIDLAHPPGLALVGALAGLADGLLDPGLRGLVDLAPQVRPLQDLALAALATGLLAAAAGSIVDRAGFGDPGRRRR
jgi:hypothetical protein